MSPCFDDKVQKLSHFQNVSHSCCALGHTYMPNFNFWDCLAKLECSPRFPQPQRRFQGNSEVSYSVTQYSNGVAPPLCSCNIQQIQNYFSTKGEGKSRNSKTPQRHNPASHSPASMETPIAHPTHGVAQMMAPCELEMEEQIKRSSDCTRQDRSLCTGSRVVAKLARGKS